MSAAFDHVSPSCETCGAEDPTGVCCTGRVAQVGSLYLNKGSRAYTVTNADGDVLSIEPNARKANAFAVATIAHAFRSGARR